LIHDPRRRACSIRAAAAENLHGRTATTLARAVLVQRLHGTKCRPAGPRRGSRPSASGRAASGVAGPPVREILPPWHIIEAQVKERQKRNDAVALGALVPALPVALAALAAQEAENAQWLTAEEVEEVEEVEEFEAPPSSGVRMSDPRLGVATPIPESLLTFKVYTLAELESRDGPGSLRLAQASLDSTQARRHARSMRCKSVVAALRAFAVATVAWWRTKQTEGFRLSPKIALRAPFDALGDALQVAVDAVDWKKYGVTTGIVVGATFTLLFGVLIAAELTDDLKPGATPHLATTEIAVPRALAAPGKPVAPASNMAAMGMQPAPPPEVAAPDPDDADPEPAPAPAKKPKAKANKLTFRNADAVFNP